MYQYIGLAVLQEEPFEVKGTLLRFVSVSNTPTTSPEVKAAVLPVIVVRVPGPEWKPGAVTDKRTVLPDGGSMSSVQAKFINIIRAIVDI